MDSPKVCSNKDFIDVGSSIKYTSKRLGSFMELENFDISIDSSFWKRLIFLYLYYL